MGSDGTARPTKADVARLAEVSTATVSYVLNNSPGRTISPRTRDAVRRAARELGYRPNLAARNLARGGSGVVLYVVPHVALGELAMEVGSRMTTVLARRGVMQILVFETEDESTVVEAVADLDPVAVTSLFPLTGATMEAVAATGVPNFHLGSSRLDELADLHLTAGEMRVAHLTGCGHTRLAYAYSDEPAWRPLGDYWLAGLEVAARSRELPGFAIAEVSTESAATIVTEWVAAGVSAVCAQSDETAFVVQHGIREAGLRCPEDLAVMGVDAIALGEVAAPPLTTVAFDATVIVEIASAALLSALGYPTATTRTAADIAGLVRRRSA